MAWARKFAYRIQKNIFDELDAPIVRVSQEDVPMPYNEQLEHAVLPNAEKIDRGGEESLLCDRLNDALNR